MKFNRYNCAVLVILIAFLAFFSAGCGSTGSGTAPADSDSAEDGTTTTVSTPAAIEITASLDTINPGETTDITAAAYDSSGNAISGVTVFFTIDNPSLAFITGSATTSSSGEATVKLTARNLPGEVNITATAESVSSSTPKKIVIFDVSAPNQINLTANPLSIFVQGTSMVTAEVRDSTPSLVPDGTSVSFAVANMLYGSITASSTTNNGIATATFQALDQPGTATITVTAGSASNSIDVDILTAPTPAAIGMTASQDSINPGETNDITAVVYDASGITISRVNVLFTLDDPTLAYITSSATTSGSGEASATLTARNLAGEVNVTATAGSVKNDPPKKIIIFDVSAPNQINLTTNPTSILVQGTSTITADVRDLDTNPVPNGTSVIFEVSNTLFGTITSSSLTNSGIATATFEALNQPGTATINVNSGSASGSIDIDILQAPASAIEFVSAEPQAIALKESGGVETAIIKFMVKDSNDDPLGSIAVLFKMIGPNGEEYIDPSDDGTPDTINVSTNNQGIAQVTLHSGYVAGPVTISGTVDVDDDTTMTVRSSVVSIGGGVPTAKRFSVSSSLLNLPGLAYQNKTADITAYLADRFGNYNVLKGTTVSFVSEIGLAIDTSAITLDEDGLATVTVRTQAGAPEDVTPLSWETDLRNDIQARYGYETTGHPRDGLSSILVYTKGEEHFDDSNANGRYDTGETFIDTTTDPFNDFNDSGDYDDDTSLDPEELYIDTGNTGSYDGSVNDEWDEDKHLFINLPILITGSPTIRFALNSYNFDVSNGSYEEVKVLICDRNLNQLTPGSTVTITTDVGKVAGNIDREYLNSNAVGPNLAGHLSLIEYTFVILDADATDTDPKEQAVITVTVEWEGITYTSGIAGTVD